MSEPYDLLVVDWPELPERYVDGVMSSFPGYGGVAAARWYLRRQLEGSTKPDILALQDATGNIIGGTGINYRLMRAGGSNEIQVGVLTSSWTADAYRGKGVFKRLIHESLHHVAKNGCSHLLAFVTSANASSYALRSAGATMFATSYLLWQPPGKLLVPEGRELREASAGEARTAVLRALERRLSLHITYPSPEAWVDQFVSRPWNTKLLTNGFAFTVLEEHRDTIRLNGIIADDVKGRSDMIGDVISHCAKLGTKCFAYATCPEDLSLYETQGFDAIPGFIACLRLDASIHAQASNPLNDVWPLGTLRWSLQAGDRM